MELECRLLLCRSSFKRKRSDCFLSTHTHTHPPPPPHTHTHTLTGDQWVLLDVARQHQTEEDGETQDEEVPGGVEVHKLQVGEPHGCDHAKQGAEQSSQHRVGQRGKQGTEFTHKPQQQHHGGSILNHTPAAHLEDRQREKVSNCEAPREQLGVKSFAQGDIGYPSTHEFQTIKLVYQLRKCTRVSQSIHTHPHPNIMTLVRRDNGAESKVELYKVTKFVETAPNPNIHLKIIEKRKRYIQESGTSTFVFLH